jgi:TIGR02452 family protein
MMNNNRNRRAQYARQTLDILEKGFYVKENNTVSIADQLRISREHTVLYSPESLDRVAKEAAFIISDRKYETKVEVYNQSSTEAGRSLLKEGKVGCLNFASAKNPGGGFLGGSLAQEESLAVASSLYPTLAKYMAEMYEYNRSRSTYLYSDYMIYSPGVVFFRDDNGQLLTQPYLMDIVTSPAVNVGAMKKNNPRELSLVQSTMMARLDKILSVFVVNGIENIVVGAWGCGVFQNDPRDVAGYFSELLGKGGKYERCFRHIVFAVLDRSKNRENIGVFENVFEKS